MTGFTRSTHTVRVKSADKRFYADVEILDAISLKLPNGFEICYKISRSNVVNPNIIDLTGDGNGKPGDSTSTRCSHMVRVTGVANPTMFFDVEVCDAFTITGPNNADFCIRCPTPGKAVPAIVDNTDSGLTVAATSDSTRAQHVVKLLHQVGSGTAGQPDQQVLTDYTLTLLTDAMSYSGPNTLGMPWQSPVSFGGPADVSSFTDYNSGPWYDAHALKFYNYADVMNGALAIGANTNDTTIYVTDPGTSQMVPPDVDPSTDPNVYVYFPQSPQSNDNTSGPFLGAAPYTTTGAPGGDGNIPAIDMGPIWWLRALGCTDNVWFWYLSPVQQPLALSAFGEPPVHADPKWGYRGTVALPTFPVFWSIAVNYPMIPMGTYGAPDLETAASGQIMTDGSIIVNWYGVAIPYKFAVSTAIGDEGALVEAGFASFLAPITYQGHKYYMPYGAFDLIGPSRKDQLDAALALHASTTFWTDYGGPPANIWELTGIAQPPLSDTTKIWNATTNPHLQPSLSLAKQAAEKFMSNWNATANGLAAMITHTDGMTNFPNTPPPIWPWSVPYGGDSVPTAQQFSNGWVPAVFELETVPITIPTIGVGQLDPTLWNVAPVVKNGNPPVLWETGVP